MTLKRHLTTSVVDARGCSGFRLEFTLCLLTHSVLSMLAMKAVVVSLLNPFPFADLYGVMRGLNNNCVSNSKAHKEIMSRPGILQLCLRVTYNFML